MAQVQGWSTVLTTRSCVFYENDEHTARCRVHAGTLGQLRATPGDVAVLELQQLHTTGERGAVVVCTMWPDTVGCIAEQTVCIDICCVLASSADSARSMAALPLLLCTAKLKALASPRVASSIRLGYAPGMRPTSHLAAVRGLPMMEGCFLLVAQGTLHAQSISPSTSTPLICGNSTVCYATAGGVESRPRISTSSVFVPQHVREIISWAIMPRMLGYMGLSSILLVGAPGTGKTYTVRQLEDIFAETRWALRVFEVSAVDLLQETIEAEHAIASIFTDAKRHAAEDNCFSVVFIDEVDALVSGMNAQAASDILLTAMCASLFEELDAIGTHANFTQTSSNSGEDTTSLGSAARMRPLRVVVVGTTNRALELGPELRRGGRFEAELTVGAASEEQRRAMFSTVLNDTFPLRDSLSREELIKELVLRTGGYTVADIVSLASELTNTFRHTQVESTVVLVNSALAKVRPSSLRGVEARVPSINFDDVIGHGVAKERLTKMLIWPLLCREQFKKFNIPTRGGVLLYGPPGVSKTKLVAAAAASAGLPLVSFSGGDVYSPYLGEAEATIRRLFDVARRAAPCVLFVDECDAIVTNRAAGGSGANSPEARVLATFLTEFDGVEDAGQVFLVGATNRPWAIDAALLRSGRLDKLLYLAPPTKAERALLFKHFMSKQRVPLQSDIDYDLLAHLTERFTGADIECVCTEVCMTALRRTLSASTPSSVLTEITASDLYGAVSAASPSVTPQMLQDLEIFACSTLPTHNLKR